MRLKVLRRGVRYTPHSFTKGAEDENEISDGNLFKLIQKRKPALLQGTDKRADAGE